MKLKITNYYFEYNNKKYYFNTVDEADLFMYHMQLVDGLEHKDIPILKHEKEYTI